MSPSNLDASPAAAAPDLSWLRRGIGVIVATTILGAVVGLLIAMVLPKTYTSKTSVLVVPTAVPDGSGGVRSIDVNMDNEIQLVRSQPVAVAARSLLRVDTPTDELLKDVTVAVPPNTLVLQIAASAGTPEGALNLSHAFAEAYLSVRTDNAKAVVDQQTESLETQIGVLQEQLKSATKEMNTASAATRPYWESQRQILVNSISQANQKLAPLRATQVDPGGIINDARLPDGPSDPSRPMFVASGAMLGLLAGLCIAYVRGGRSRRVRSVADVGTGAVPAFEVVGGVGGPDLLPTGGGAEVFDRLRLALNTAVSGDRPAMLVCPAAAGLGASLVTVNLANSLARTGHRVLVVCAEANSRTPQALGIRAGGGLADCLRDSLQLADRVQVSTSSPRIAAVPPGSGLDEALSVSSAERLALLLLQLRQNGELVRAGDYVLVEAPDTRHGVDAQELARVCDAAVVVAETGRSTVRAVEQTETDLRSVGVAIAARVVVPQVPGPTPSHAPTPGSLEERISAGTRMGQGHVETRANGGPTQSAGSASTGPDSLTR